MDEPRRAFRKQLGEILLDRGWLQPDQLEQGLAIQNRQGGLLGQILVELGFVTEEQVVQAVTEQYGFPYLPLKQYTVDPAAVRLVPANVARQYCLIPVDRLADTLSVAMADPLNVHAVEDLETLSHCSVQVFMSTISDVNEMIQQHYRKPAEGADAPSN